MIRYVLLAIVLVEAACRCSVPSDRFKRTAESAGLHDVKATDTAFTGCGSGDVYGTNFKARNTEGKAVRGTICCGWMKNCTVRYE